MCFELLFPSPLCSLDAFNSCREQFKLVGYPTNPQTSTEEQHSRQSHKYPCPCCQSILNLSDQAANPSIPGGFTSVSSVHSLLARGKWMLPKTTALQWRHQLLPHQLLSCHLREHMGNLQRLQQIFVWWRLQIWVNLESGVKCFFQAKQNTEFYPNNSGHSAATRRIAEAYFLLFCSYYGFCTGIKPLPAWPRVIFKTRYWQHKGQIPLHGESSTKTSAVTLKRRK